MALIEARYHDRVNVLQALNGLASLNPCSLAPFDRAEWYQLLADSGLVPLVAVASEDDCTAALALAEDRGRIVPLRNWYSFTWRPLAHAGETGDRLLGALARDLKSRGYRAVFEPVPDEDGSATRLAAAFPDAGWKVATTPRDINHVLYLRGRSFAEYWPSRPGPLRTTLKRKGKKVTTEITTAFDQTLWEH
ncbi:MAG: hypothetical protein ACXIT4_08845 [Erythrobacter sp.]